MEVYGERVFLDKGKTTSKTCAPLRRHTTREVPVRCDPAVGIVASGGALDFLPGGETGGNKKQHSPSKGVFGVLIEKIVFGC